MYYYVKDEENNNREDCIKYADGTGAVWYVPADDGNYMWRDYQAWLAEGNSPQSE